MPEAPSHIAMKPARPEDAPMIARMWWDTFPLKFGHILGECGPEFLEGWLKRDPSVFQSVYIAWESGHPAGYIQISGVHHVFFAHIGPLWTILQEMYGIGGAMKRMLQFCIGELGNILMASDLYIYMLGVAAQARGKGVGWHLLTFAEEQAVAQGRKRLKLTVVGENATAIRLYERYGFAKGRLHGSRLLNWAYGSNSYYVMIKHEVRKPTE